MRIWPGMNRCTLSYWVVDAGSIVSPQRFLAILQAQVEEHMTGHAATFCMYAGHASEFLKSPHILVSKV